MNDSPNFDTTPAAGHRDVDFHAAVASVRRAIENFQGCSPNERLELARDLNELENMAEK